jgi:transcriptional regulator with XRE-family HTH domain
MGTLQDRIKQRRELLGLTLLEIANRLGVKEATVQRYESGEIKNIKHTTIVRLAEILHTTPTYLMGWDAGSGFGDGTGYGGGSGSGGGYADGTGYGGGGDGPGQGYYLDPETAQLAQEMFDNPNMRILFDASRKATPEDLKKIAEMAKIMVGDDDEGC